MRFKTPLRLGKCFPILNVDFTFLSLLYYFPLGYMGIWMHSGTYFFSACAKRMDLFIRATFQTRPVKTLKICIL